MITGTFYGSNVRVESRVDKEPPVYYVQAYECEHWETVGVYDEAKDPLARDEAIKLAQRLAKKVNKNED